MLVVDEVSLRALFTFPPEPLAIGKGAPFSAILELLPRLLKISEMRVFSIGCLR